MSRAKKGKIISISFTLILMLFVVFAMLIKISETSSTPFIGSGGDLSDGALPGLSGLSVVPLTPDSSGTAAQSDEVGGETEETPLFEDDNFITVQMDSSDVHRGNLILINGDTRYEIPDESDIVDISGQKTKSYRVADSALLLSGSIIDPLNEMMDAFFDETGCDTVTVISAFRDYQRQQEILDDLTATVGRTEARKRAAVPGHSEHHAGLAVDFGVFSDGNISTFFGTGTTAWFVVNAYKYGFIPRYPENKTEITKTAYEPWHFRYVGSPHAYFIRQHGFCFEEYMDFVMGFTSDKPFNGASYDGTKYEIYFTPNSEIVIPSDREADISGNNKNGFIVTIKL